MFPASTLLRVIDAAGSVARGTAREDELNANARV